MTQETPLRAADVVVPADHHRPAGWVDLADAAASDEPPRPPLRPFYRAAMAVAPAIGLVLIFGVWELYVRIWNVRRLTLPTPSSILVHVVDSPGFYWRQSQVTLKEAALGLGIGFTAAMIVATLMAHSRFAERAAMPVIVLLQAMPVAVLAPVFLIWFGFNIWPKVLVAALFTFIPFAFNAFTGLRSVDPNVLELMRSVSASRREIFVKLRLPHSLPYLFSAGRICIGLALVGAVVGEMFAGSTAGLGNTARIAQTRLLIDQLWGSIFVLAFIGVTFNLILSAVETRVLRWQQNTQNRRR